MTIDRPDLLVAHLFREEAGRMVSRLTHVLGARHLDLAEDAVQDALMRALHTWPLQGVPEQPAAWLFTAARNRALDKLRRDQWFVEREAVITSALRA
ncbi:MAG TPA: sigma factor, partial [Luteitalea sp.]|nr:sigma factor [Luteitalea sp.]